MRETQKEDFLSEGKGIDDVALPDSIKDLIDKSQIHTDEKEAIEVEIASSFKGPLPPPELLCEYDKIVEGGAERMFLSYETQSQHRMNLEAHVIKEELRQSSRGQLFGFIISVFGLLLSGALACMGHEIVAAIIGGSTIVSLTATFVVGKISQKR